MVLQTPGIHQFVLFQETRHAPQHRPPALPLPARGRDCCPAPGRAAGGAGLGRRRPRRGALGTRGAREPAAVLGHGKPAQGIPDLQRRGPGPDAPGRGPAARARCRNGDRADGRPAGSRRLRRRGRLDTGEAVVDGHRHVQALPARVRPRAGPDGQAGRAHRGGRHAARGAAAGPPVRSGADHRRGHEGGDSGAQEAAQPPVQLRHAGRRCAHRGRRAALPGQLRKRHRRHRPGRRPGAPPGAERRHLHQAQRAAPTLRRRAARARDERTGAARVDAVPRGRGGQPEPDHRRRGGGPARTLAGRVRGAGRAGGRTLPAVARSGPGHAGLPDARGRADRAHRRAGPPVPYQVHVPPGQGRLLGRRDQARAGAGPARLPGVHPQAPHRRELPGLRQGAAGRARCDLSAVRHAQRRHDCGHPATCIAQGGSV